MILYKIICLFMLSTMRIGQGKNQYLPHHLDKKGEESIPLTAAFLV